MKAAVLSACAAAALFTSFDALAASVCAPSWQRSVELRLGSADSLGHGPDLGSDEWQGVVEFRLGLRGASALPARDSAAWCTLIEQQLARHSGVAPAPPPSLAPAPPACRAKAWPGRIPAPGRPAAAAAAVG